MGHSSPTEADHTAQTATLPSHSQAWSVERPDAFWHYNGSIPSLQDLSLVPPGSTSPSDLPSPMDPLSRWGNDAPWSIHSTRNPIVHDNQPIFHESNELLGNWHAKPLSDIDSTAQTSDEGYHTQALQSNFGYNSSETNQGFHVETSDVEKPDVDAIASDTFAKSRTYSHQHQPTRSRTAKQGTRTTQCPKCEVVSTCNSDHKYVLALRCSHYELTTNN